MTHSLSIIPENKVKKGSHRTCNSGPIEFPTETPKLVRSPGIRRDWSFEDLQRQIGVFGMKENVFHGFGFGFGLGLGFGFGFGK
ncbi:hypothetical protein H5410_032797 [Solanum commersonii]|uniref:Uncharacterized protein n=1 Tax=Solanum commersonii TaxID=4109 RepID=A0A9J5YKZ0_SOLCO|nr:hypothetical protein H5410_032797 [Solanum commersonii]